MFRFRLSVLFALVTLCLTMEHTAVAQCELAELLASDGSSYDNFGSTVSMSGGTVAVGARGVDDFGCTPFSCSSVGAVYVFDPSGGNWSETVKLTAIDGVANDYFGNAVAIDGDTLAIGAVGNDELGAYAGAAYVFGRSGGLWGQEAKLLPSDGGEDFAIGAAVAIDGDVIVVGAPWAATPSGNTGAVYVFRFEVSAWVEEAKLIPSDGAIADRFGSSVEVSGDHVLVGAPHRDEVGEISGAAYLFEFDGVNWTEVEKLVPGDAAAGDGFGAAVDVQGTVAIIGAHENCLCSIFPSPSGDPGPGTAYVYRFDGASWNEEQKLGGSETLPGSWFGGAVAIDGDVAIVGSRADHDLPAYGVGATYLFRFDGAAWAEEARIVSSDALGGDEFGAAVALEGEVALIGAHNHGETTLGTGAAYLYRLDVADCGIGLFTRGDANADGSFDISDAIFSLAALFSVGGAMPLCEDAADTNDDGQFDVADPVSALATLFVAMSPPPPGPFPGCGLDPTLDALPCVVFPACP